MTCVSSRIVRDDLLFKILSSCHNNTYTFADLSACDFFSSAYPNGADVHTNLILLCLIQNSPRGVSLINVQETYSGESNEHEINKRMYDISKIDVRTMEDVINYSTPTHII